MAPGTAPAAGPPGVKGKGNLLDWAKKHPGGAAAAVGGAGVGAYVLYKRNQANSAADTSDTSTGADAGTVGPPADFGDGSDGGAVDSGDGSDDDSSAYDQLEAQEQALQTQLSTLTSAQNPPPGTNWYQMAKSLLQKSGDADPTVKQIDKERSKLLRLLGPGAAPKTAAKKPAKKKITVPPLKKKKK